jgi:putative phosphoesterase
MTSPDPAPSPQRIAILADIHGNPFALDAVLAEIEAVGGVDAYWLLGDYAAIGFDPLGVMERITNLSNAVFIRGNADRLAATLSEMDPWNAEVEKDPEMLPVLIQVNRSFSWTNGALASAGWLPWFSELPLERRFTLPDGTRVLLVHASPGTDDGVGIHPRLSDDELRELVTGADADLIFIGHTHAPLDRQVDGIRVVNPGSVGNPVLPEAGAFYALLENELDGYRLTLHEVKYDRVGSIAATVSSHHPASEYIVSFMLGDRVPGWAEE